MARFLIDEALPRSLARRLREDGHDAEDVRDLGLRGQSDEQTSAEAQRRDSVLITRDLGFANTLRRSRESHTGVVILRLPKFLSTARLVEEVLRNAREVSLTTLDRSVVVVEPGRIRIRRFP